MNEGDKTRSRERYMIVKISGNTCKAIKLQKTNLPKKEYDLKLTEVFPVASTIEISQSGSKGLESSDDELEDEQCTSTENSLPTIIDNTHYPSYVNPVTVDESHVDSYNMLPVTPVPVMDNFGENFTENTGTPTANDAPAEVDPPEESTSRRSVRSRRRPAHLDDYEC